MPSMPPVREWLERSAAAHPTHPAVLADDRTWTYADLHDAARAWVARLADAGLTQGDRVATLTHNRAEHLALFFACARAGVVLVPLSWRLTARELADQLHAVAAAVLVVEPACHSLATDTVERLEQPPVVWDLTETSGTAMTEAGAHSVHDDDPLLMLFTGGTTGRPKAAVLTHGSCWWTNRSLDEVIPLAQDDVVLAVLPQFHVAGWNVQPLLAVAKGATVVLPRQFEPAVVLELVSRHRVSTMMGVPATYAFMAEQPGFAGADLTSLRNAVVGGAPCPPELMETWQRRGVPISQGYGLTEAGPNVLCVPPADALRKVGCAGRPYPHVEVALRGDDGALVTGPGRGELLVRGGGVFAGYWNDRDASRHAVRDGWLHTGDIAERDADGFYRICARVDDVFISGGENVYPAEVEEVLLEHWAVAEAAVVPVPDERWGRTGLALVRLRPGAAVDAEGLREHCRGSLAGFKIPSRVELVETLPRSPMGKLLRSQLHDRVTSGAEAGGAR